MNFFFFSYKTSTKKSPKSYRDVVCTHLVCAFLPFDKLFSFSQKQLSWQVLGWNPWNFYSFGSLTWKPKTQKLLFSCHPQQAEPKQRLDGYFMFEILASKQWGQHSVGGPDTTAVLKQRAYISNKAHKRQDLPRKNYIQQKWRWGRGHACTRAQGKHGITGNGAIKN